ncbi:MAG: hypothetical protein NTV82_04595 [Candidatus Aminicenantes bacterium]|nr:hypothetical protein [Candidatus Aminicenantes bacterium]
MVFAIARGLTALSYKTMLPCTKKLYSQPLNDVKNEEIAEKGDVRWIGVADNRKIAGRQ